MNTYVLQQFSLGHWKLYLEAASIFEMNYSNSSVERNLSTKPANLIKKLPTSSTLLHAHLFKLPCCICLLLNKLSLSNTPGTCAACPPGSCAACCWSWPLPADWGWPSCTAGGASVPSCASPWRWGHWSGSRTACSWSLSLYALLNDWIERNL